MINKILIIAGTHGVEPQSRDFALKLSEASLDQKGSFEGFPFDLIRGETNNGKSITIIPNLNEWGLKNNSRTNENGVDLNRNMPSENWVETFEYPAYHPGSAAGSEKETQGLLEVMKEGFDLVLSFHTTHFVHYVTPPQVNLDGEKEGDAYKFCKDLAKAMELPLTDDFGRTCHGSLGSYCKDHKIPCITIELEEELSSEELWDKYSKAFLDLILEKNKV